MSFRRTTEHGNADALSQLPMPVKPPVETDPPELVLLPEQLQDSVVTARDIATWTKQDPVLANVLQFIQHGWPAAVDNPQFNSFFARKDELSVLNECILRGNRVCVPEPGRQTVLSELHEGHLGMCKMKSLARQYVWVYWQRCGKQVQVCQACQMVKPAPSPVLLNPLEMASTSVDTFTLELCGSDGKSHVSGR